MYRVADHKFTLCFTDNSVLSEVIDQTTKIDRQSFRFRTFEEFERNCDLRGDLYDIIGHLKLINGENLTQRPQIDTSGDAQKDRVSIHLQPKQGPIVNIYLWDTAAAEFRSKFNAMQSIPSVLLVTTVNPKKLGGRLSLCSMSSSRVFMDTEVAPTREYLAWLEDHAADVATVDASQVTKVETVTINDILNFLKKEPAQKATFHCIATIDAIQHEKGWYYIGCTDCGTKINKGPSTLVCHKCNNANAMGVIKFRLEYSVHDKETEATFVFLDDSATELIGRKPTELIDEHVEGNGEMGEGHEVPQPECLSEVINQTHKFEIRVSKYNFRATRQTFTVAKIIKPKGPDDSDINNIDENGETNSAAPDGKSSTGTEDTSGNMSVNQTGNAIEETTETSSKRPRLNT